MSRTRLATDHPYANAATPLVPEGLRRVHRRGPNAGRSRSATTRVRRRPPGQLEARDSPLRAADHSSVRVPVASDRAGGRVDGVAGADPYLRTSPNIVIGPRRHGELLRHGGDTDHRQAGPTTSSRTLGTTAQTRTAKSTMAATDHPYVNLMATPLVPEVLALHRRGPNGTWTLRSARPPRRRQPGRWTCSWPTAPPPVPLPNAQDLVAGVGRPLAVDPGPRQVTARSSTTGRHSSVRLGANSITGGR